MRSTLAATLRIVLYLAIPAAVGLIVLRVPLVQLLFQRGAFTETSTQMVAWALALFALGLPAHAGVEITVRAFYALHDTKTPVAVGLAAMGLNLGFSLAFVAAFQVLDWPAHGGLALSNSLATTIEMIVLGAIVRSRLDGLEGRKIARSLFTSMLSAVAMGIVIWILTHLLDGLAIWLICGVAVLIGILVYGGASLALGGSEPRALREMFMAGRRLRR
jgi:putative peptidoglycan lipid II flippase